MGVQKVERSMGSFMVKLASKDSGTMASYKTALNNFENFCMEKYGKSDIISELKSKENEEVFDILQAWINWNKDKSPRTIANWFSRIKKYLHHRGIKLHIQDIKEELNFPRKIEEEKHPLSLDEIHIIIKHMQYKQKTQFICQLSSLMRIGELVQLRKKHLISSNQNIIVKIPANIAKFKKGRTTFFSKEASKLLRPILRNLEDNDLIFGSNEDMRTSEVNSVQTLKRILIKTGLDMKYDTVNRYLINTHSFRAYGITKISRHDPNFAKKLAGQKGYLLEYDRMTDEEKLEVYQKYESDLIIDNTEKQKAEIEKLESEKSELEKSKKKVEMLKDSDLMRKLVHEEIQKMTPEYHQLMGELNAENEELVKEVNELRKELAKRNKKK